MFESAVRSSSIKSVGAPADETSRRFYYERLMQVTIRNTFYNASGDRCPDFKIVPTDATASLMHSLGMLFKDEDSGFSVLLDQLREQAFLDYLRTQHSPASSPPSSPPGGAGVWTRLSFALTLRNAYFLNFTDIPIGMRPGVKTFYLSNTTAQTGQDGKVLLDPGGIKSDTPIALTGSQCRVTVQGADTQRLVVQDIAGEEVMCQPVYWPRHDPNSPSCAASEADTSSVNTPDLVRRNPIYLDFSLLPEDKYRIEECTNQYGDCVAASGVPPGVSANDVVYAVSSGPPLFFIDLLFTNPGISGGVYPVENLADESQTVIVPVQYYLEFERRSTTWNYYIVPTSAPLTGLKIDTIAPLSASSSSSPVTFTGPTAVTLPGNQQASLFVSDSAIPLEEQSEYNFQLLGSAGGVEMKNGVLMNRLPVASSQQVIPGSGDYATSDSRSTGKAAPAQLGKVFSDIYVYV